MLEQEIRRFKLGQRMYDEEFHDSFHPGSPKHTPRIHATRVDGLNEQMDAWEGAGYLTALLKNAVMHPLRTYELFTKED